MQSSDKNSTNLVLKIIIRGPRRSGKQTLMKQLSKYSQLKQFTQHQMIDLLNIHQEIDKINTKIQIVRAM